MGNPTLTKVLIAALIGTFLIAMLFGAYSEFAVINHSNIDERYQEAFTNIAAQYNNFGTIATVDVGDQGLVKSILDVGKSGITAAMNVFVVGLDAIGGFFNMIPIIRNIVSVIGNVIPGIQPLLGLFTLILILYIAMSYIKSVSNKPDLP